MNAVLEQEIDRMILDQTRGDMLEEIMVMRWGWIVL